ncbi:MAG: hypothetical protein ABIJ21_04065 [Nanoarchaeota archaeon]
MKKKGQNASGAAVLVAAIAAILIAYILFLPPAERDALLGDGNGGTYPGGTPGGTGTHQPVTLFQQNIGTISLAETNSIEHSVPSIKVLTQIAANEIRRVDSLYVKRGAFEEVQKDVKFSLEPFASQNLLLSYNVKKGKGRLIISLNGEEIHNDEIAKGSPDPIRLDENLIGKDNVLTFGVSSPGGAFWNLNEYQLEEVVVSGDVTDYSRTGAEQHFSISDNEYQNLERGELKYNPGCQYATTLIVSLNGQPTFSGIPRCNAINTLELAKNRLNPGDNYLTFEAPAGSYDVTGIKLKTYLNKPINQVYYFDLPPELFDYLYKREMQAYAFISFPEEGTTKQGTFTLNSHKQSFKTTDSTYTLRISSYLKEGTNSLMITPAGSSLEVAELVVELR